MIVPLNFLYHLYNGVSVLGALLYNILIDKPLPGLKAAGTGLQKLYWSRLHTPHHRRSKPANDPPASGKAAPNMSEPVQTQQATRKKREGIQAAAIVKPSDSKS